MAKEKVHPGWEKTVTETPAGIVTTTTPAVIVTTTYTREKDSKAADMINHPSHYTAGKIEPIDVIEDWRLGFCLGNTVKYVARADHKGSRLEDLRKAAWYLNREILKESGGA